MTDITELKRALAGKARLVAEYLLPRGSVEGKDWCVGSLAGEEGKSLRVCISGSNAGRWADFAAAGESGDLIDLWCNVKAVGLIQSLDQIRDWLGIKPPEFEKQERKYKLPKRPKCTTPKSDVLKYLTEDRLITREAISKYKVGENEREIIFPSLSQGELVFVKKMSLDRSESGKKIVHVEPGCEPILFGWQAIDPEAREVCITEGELDALTSYDYGWPALSVPFGGGGGAKQQWIASEFERMSRFEIIYLALDHDPEGEMAVAEITNRLGAHRCRRVILPFKDMNECRQKGITPEEISKCFAAAKTIDPPELTQAGMFADAVVGLFWPVSGVEPGYRLPFTKVSDRLLFRPGELTEWTGATGVGKSVLLSHALISMGEQGARACVASLEMAPAQLIRRMVKQSGNIDRPTERFIRHIIAWLDEWLWIFGVVGKSKTDRLLEVFEYARARYGCDVFVVDSLMRLGVGSDDYEGQERAVYTLVDWAVAKSVHIHLVAHSRKTDRGGGHGNQHSGIPDAEDVKGTSEIASNAFNILGVWRNRKLEDDIKALSEEVERGSADAQAKLDPLLASPTVTVNVAKQRNGDWEGKFGLWFEQRTYQYHGLRDDREGRRFAPRMED